MTTKLNPGKPDGGETPAICPTCQSSDPIRRGQLHWNLIPSDWCRDAWHGPSPQPSAEATEPIKVAGPYSIGSPHWNGLSKLIEECGEVSQVCGKILGTGGTPDHWDGTHLPSRLEEELADLMAAAQYVIRRNSLSMFKIDERVMKKLDLFDTWNGANNGKL